MEKNATMYEMNGWKYISVYGSAKERGYAYGYVVAKEMKKIQEMMRFIVMQDTGYPWEHFIEISEKYFNPVISKNFPEFYEEMQGITDGCNAAGTTISLDEVIAWNNSIVLLGYWKPTLNKNTTVESSIQKEGGGIDDHCSAFIACGEYTSDGQIVCAHNSFCNFIDGQYYNIILDLNPSDGHRILMQTCPGWIWSGSDFFITSKGIIGTETTIGGFNQYDHNDPISCRIRKAMQYGNSLDEYVSILLEKNSGGYANSWLFGDIHTNEIMKLELGLKYHSLERSNNGYFFGCNVAFDPQIRNLECVNTGYCDVRRHQGARQVRLPDLMDTHKGKINIEVAKKIISDHYDVYLKKENPCSRTVCAHYDLDPREFMSQSDRPKPFQTKGAIDGAVVDSNMAKEMKIMMRFGNSCGKIFDPEKFFKHHRQWDYLKPYLNKMGGNPWTEFTITNKETPTTTPTTTPTITPTILTPKTVTETLVTTSSPSTIKENLKITETFSLPEKQILEKNNDISSTEIVNKNNSTPETEREKKMDPVLESLRSSVPPSLLNYYSKKSTFKSNKNNKNKTQKK
jgi:hypothetical protein